MYSIILYNIINGELSSKPCLMRGHHMVVPPSLQLLQLTPGRPATKNGGKPRPLVSPPNIAPSQLEKDPHPMTCELTDCFN